MRIGGEPRRRRNNHHASGLDDSRRCADGAARRRGNYRWPRALVGWSGKPARSDCGFGKSTKAMSRSPVKQRTRYLMAIKAEDREQNAKGKGNNLNDKEK